MSRFRVALLKAHFFIMIVFYFVFFEDSDEGIAVILFYRIRGRLF